jgi:hypothetical protein
MNGEGDVLEIKEFDATMRKVGSWKFNTRDKKLANNILSYIIKKYEFNPNIKIAEEDKDIGIDLRTTW